MSFGDRSGRVDALLLEVVAIGAQVSLVGLEGVLRGASLDADVVEPAADLPIEPGGPRRRRRCRIRQDSASSSVIDAIPWASATGA
jgi:hypothetical protein